MYPSLRPLHLPPSPNLSPSPTPLQLQPLRARLGCGLDLPSLNRFSVYFLHYCSSICTRERELRRYSVKLLSSLLCFVKVARFISKWINDEEDVMSVFNVSLICYFEQLVPLYCPLIESTNRSVHSKYFLLCLCFCNTLQASSLVLLVKHST